MICKNAIHFCFCLKLELFSGHPNRSTHSKHVNIRTAQLSLLPFILFIILFLGTGLYMQSQGVDHAFEQLPGEVAILLALIDRKSTRLNSSHVAISYAV